MSVRSQENIPIEEVFDNLRCSSEGLTSEAAQERLSIFGHNKLEEKKVCLLLLGLWIWFCVELPFFFFFSLWFFGGLGE